MIHKIKIEFVDNRKPHIFTLGLGPCGRVVERLEARPDDENYTVRQYVEGEEGPVFLHYPARNVLRYVAYTYDPSFCPLRRIE
jgi:hypothetical protein